MTGYTRGYFKVVGDVIVADDFNNEYQNVDDAFDTINGHKHDGSTDEGGYVPLISDFSNLNSVEVDENNDRVGVFINVNNVKVEQLRVVDGSLLPAVHNDVDVGSSNVRFKDVYVHGDVITNSITPEVINAKAVVETVHTITGTVLNPDNGTIQILSPSGNITLTESFSSGQSMLLHIVNSSGFTISFPTITWIEGVPALTGNDMVGFWKIGSVLYGRYIGSV